MNSTYIFKPIVWRLILWKFVPIYLGMALYGGIRYLTKGSSNFLAVETAIIGLVVITIFSIISRKKFDIVISDGKISGQGAGIIMSRESFAITDIDFSKLHQQTLYEKISCFRTIRSITDQQIMVTDFIYGKPATAKLYTILENEKQ